MTDTPPTIITLVLPTPENGGIAPEVSAPWRTVTLHIQRGDVAHARFFHYHGYLPDLMTAIRESTEALGEVPTPSLSANAHSTL